MRGPTTNSTLRELEERRDPALYFRAHGSSLVNLKHVKEVVPWFGGRYKLVMRDAASSEVALSRAQRRGRCARGSGGEGRPVCALTPFCFPGQP